MQPNSTEERCGRLTRRNLPCKNRAGYKTEHVGVGACWLHGGNSPGAPKQNTYAVTTGQYQTLHVSALEPEQAALYTMMSVAPRYQAETSVRLAAIREHRILLLQRDVAASADEEGFGISLIRTNRGWEKKGKVDTTEVERVPVIQTHITLETALSAIQNIKLRAVNELRNAIKEDPVDSGGLDAIVQAIDRSAQAIVADESLQRELDAAEGLAP
jgi:uncharacterized protein YjcR